MFLILQNDLDGAAVELKLAGEFKDKFLSDPVKFRP